MALLWGTLLLATHHCVYGRDARKLQSAEADMAVISETLTNATSLTQAQLSAIQNESAVADNSIPIPSSKSPFVSVLYYLQWNTVIPMQKFAFPIIKSGSQEWLTMWWNCLIFPAILLGCGSCCSLQLCRNKDKFKGKYQGKEPPNLSTVGQYTFYTTVVIMCLVVVAIGAFFNTIVAIDGVVRELSPEVDYVNETIATLQPKIHNADLYLASWLQSCAGYDQLKSIGGATFQEIETKNDEYVQLLGNQTMTIYNVTNEISLVPGYMKSANDVVEKMMHYQIIIGLLCALPTLILTCCLLGLIKQTQKQGGSRLYDTHDKHGHSWLFSLACCNCCVVLASFVVAYIAVFFGLFCEQTEINTVHLASAFQYGNGTSQGTQIVSYYLTGNPAQNVIVESLRTVRNTLQTVSNSLWLLRPALEVVGLACKDMGFIDPSQLLGDAVPRINQILPLTKRDRVYYFFDELTNRAVCKNAIDSLSMTLISQVIICIFLVPYVGTQINKYLLDWQAYNQKVNEDRDKEKQTLLKGGYHCTRCRAYFPLMEDPRLPETKKEWFTDYNQSVMEYTEYSMKFQDGAKAMICPNCHHSGTLKPGARKKTYDDGTGDKPCTQQ
jgi:hypothetical protein